jgi:hypothetical protein
VNTGQTQGNQLADLVQGGRRVSALADISDQPEQADAVSVLEEVEPAPRRGRLVAQWIPDPQGARPLICVWVRQHDDT